MYSYVNNKHGNFHYHCKTKVILSVWHISSIVQFLSHSPSIFPEVSVHLPPFGSHRSVQSILLSTFFKTCTPSVLEQNQKLNDQLVILEMVSSLSIDIDVFCLNCQYNCLHRLLWRPLQTAQSINYLEVLKRVPSSGVLRK